MKTTATKWEDKHLGALKVESGNRTFQVRSSWDRLTFGLGKNKGTFREAGYMLREDGETLDAALCELLADLDVYYTDGERYMSRVLCNALMGTVKEDK